MTKNNDRKSIDKLLEALQERAKELNCLYAIEEILKQPDVTPDDVFHQVVEAIPPGWQYPDVCQAKIVVDETTYTSPGFKESPWVLSADIIVQDRAVGTVYVYYTKEMPAADDGPFLKEESKLIQTIADRLGHFLLHYQMKQVYQDWDHARENLAERKPGEWRTVLELLQQTDRNLFVKISHMMLNHLCWSGVAEAEKLLKTSSTHYDGDPEDLITDANQPYRHKPYAFAVDISSEIFRIASEHMSDDELIRLIQRWLHEDKLSFLVQVVNRNLPLSEVADAVRRYHHLTQQETDLQSPAAKGVTVSLIRRFLSDQLQYINVAKNFIDIDDFYHLLNHMIFATESHGKLGGKSAGLYLASQILQKEAQNVEAIGLVKVPKTWHISSDMLLHFMHYNNLDEIVEQKYKPIDQVRFEYPHIVYSFKNAHFPTEMVKGLSMALDDFGDSPLIVRSSSLLEDRVGAAFSGKYKSLFLANQGSKRKRLDALLDAIAEVYASTFGPDPIEYRDERGLIDFGEEMGIMIQEVVGNRIGDYFLPSFAGVAFSRNEFRWSPRIKREDGLVRLVPGLGTRAVDRLADDYPVLVAPGQPGLRVNSAPDEIAKYAPQYVDVINLKKNVFETIQVNDLLEEYGYQLPGVHRMVSIFSDGHLRKPMGTNIDFDRGDLVVTFEGLLSDSTFVAQIKNMLTVLEEKLGMPVDIEFAHDGTDLYILQCRSQSHTSSHVASPIPKDIPDDRLIFTANRYVSNGRVPDITHVVYIDPEKYGELSSREELLSVGRAVGKLNKLLPKRQFILMGPGRWGSRGDIKLGVSVTYSDINNTAMLTEVARQKGNYVPDLSFGTHFFQDLVETDIRYLPLYPDDTGVAFNEDFLKGSPNLLPQLLPDYAHLADTIRLIDVPKVADGRVLKVLMNADLDKAVGLLAPPSTDFDVPELTETGNVEESGVEHHWRWRAQMVDEIAARINPERFGVKAMYVFGSTKNATADESSDINLLLHVDGSAEQRQELCAWLEGWSLSLAEMNYLRTGHRRERMLDVHLITDEDIETQTPYAAKIDAVTDPARELMMGAKLNGDDTPCE